MLYKRSLHTTRCKKETPHMSNGTKIRTNSLTRFFSSKPREFLYSKQIIKQNENTYLLLKYMM